MKAFAFARRAASGLAAGSAASAAQPTANARDVLVAQVPANAAACKVDDQDWLVTDVDGQEGSAFIFKPFSPCDVDSALEQVHAMMQTGGRSTSSRPGPQVTIEEVSPNSDSESYTSLGTEADSVLGQPLDQRQVTNGSDLSRTGERDHGQMHDLLKLAGILLKRPGLQREVFKCMLEDEEVRDLLLKQSQNLDAYLTAVGVHNPALLTEAEASDDNAGDDDQKPVLQHILEAVAACIDKTNSWMAGFGCWLRDRISGLGSFLSHAMGMDTDDDSTASNDRQNTSSRPSTPGRVMLAAAMVVSVAVFCVLLSQSALVRTAAVTVAATACAQRAQKTKSGSE